MTGISDSSYLLGVESLARGHGVGIWRHAGFVLGSASAARKANCSK
jgi:hypothetical protein